MPRVLRVEIDLYCDVCYGELEHETNARDEDAIRFTVNGKAKRLDVCTKHRDPKWSAILQYMQDDKDATPRTNGRGRPKSGWISAANRAEKYVAEGKGTVDCPLNCGVPPLAANALGVGAHLARAHKDIPIEQRRKMAKEAVGTK